LRRSKTEGKLRQAREGLEQAREELGAVHAERQIEEEGLAAFRKRAEKEKEDIDRELEEYRRKANVTREEIIGATQLKNQLASSGFTIQFTLDLCKEFICRDNAREELTKAIEEHGTLTKSNAALIQQAEAQKETLTHCVLSTDGQNEFSIAYRPLEILYGRPAIHHRRPSDRHKFIT
jgi:hypothetical protein